MIRSRTFRWSRPLAVETLAATLMLIAGCDNQSTTEAAVSDFIVSFARNALAAFLL